MKNFCPLSFFFQPHGNQVTTLAQGGTQGPVNSVTAFFRNLANCGEGRLHREENLLNSLSNMSSITTPSGPWVYTVVPWED